MGKIRCPQCGYEINTFFSPPYSGAWTPEEDKHILNAYQNERKLIREIAAELNRSQDAVRNRLYILRGAGRVGTRSGTVVAVHMSIEEYDGLRAAYTLSVRAQNRATESEEQLREIMKAADNLATALVAIDSGAYEEVGISLKKVEAEKATALNKVIELVNNYYMF